MSTVMEAGTQSAIKKGVSGVRKLSDRDLQKGAEILGSLPTVQRYLRYNDTSSSLTVQQIAKSVVANDRYCVSFTDYIRPVAGYEYPHWEGVIEEILFVRRDYFDELSRREFDKPVLWAR